MLFARRDAIDLTERLGELVRHGLPLEAPVVVHWNDHHVPFIEAQHDDDLAVALGVIHVHLRWGQMEILRRTAFGRVSEMIGPFGIRIDHALRTLNLARTATIVLGGLPPETARWLNCFVAGINRAIEGISVRPPELRLLGIGREQWQATDILAVGRLLAADATWPALFALMREQDRSLAVEIWKRALELEPAGVARPASDGVPAPGDRLDRWLGRTGGSNSMAISAARSASGGACIASDPHLPVMLPNPFLIAGYKSPSFHVVGLMIAGLPFVALGRNERIAWGSTNLHAASSDLFDVSDLQTHEFIERREHLKVRWWRDRALLVRDSPHGPVVSDLASWRSHPGAVALCWTGNLASDEITAMLKVNRARDWNEFRQALAGFGVPGQRMTYADIDGHVGILMAARLPCRPVTAPADFILPPEAGAHWKGSVTASDLPAQFDPPEGFVVSANEKPPGTTPVRIGYLFSSSARAERLAALLGRKVRHALPDLAEFQLDVTVPRALALRDKLVRCIPVDDPPRRQRDFVRALLDWDGRYAADSRGALAFELLLFHLAGILAGNRRRALYEATWNGRDLVCADVAAAGATLPKAVQKAMGLAAPEFATHKAWGDVHRLQLRHPLAMIPVFGRRYRLADRAAAGGEESVFRAGHRLAAGRHRVSLATSARHLSDLADPDANHFILLGGQDGRLGSTTMLDQVPLWQAGRLIQVPLTLEAVRRSFTFRTEFLP